MNSRRRRLCAAFAVVALSNSVVAYGPTGHEIVGSVADELIAGTPAAEKISKLIDGMTLERASTVADEIKGWDKRGVDDQKSFHYSAYRNLDRQLRDFWRANAPAPDASSTAPSHHWFHYTDVPVTPPQKYHDGATGRSNWDIVHMISYCIQVVEGHLPENNERKITKPIGVILLAHYVADIHQPLHVGAEYFDQQGRIADPDKNKSALGDEGGNTFALELSDEPPRRRGIHKKKFHGFWDFDAVNALFPGLPSGLHKSELQSSIEPLKKTFVHGLATHDPANWRLPSSVPVEAYAEVWADEILPIAREAHERLKFRYVEPTLDGGRFVAAGEAIENTAPDRTPYRAWATNVVRDELHKAGWRLADLLKKIL
jgi:S1/P1 nuclease